MAPGANGGWLSLLQRRAEYARGAAATARTPAIAHEFEELAQMYEGAASRAEVALSIDKKPVSRVDPRLELIKHLQSKSHKFLMDARGATNRTRADELKLLAGAFGAEAARIKNDGMV